MNNDRHITQAEWPIMQVLWERETATASEIVETVTAQREVSMRTVKTLIRRLVDRGAISYTVDSRDSRKYHYRAAVSRESCEQAKTSELLESLSGGGDKGELLLRFISDTALTAAEIEKLEQLLAQKKKGEPQ